MSVRDGEEREIEVHVSVEKLAHYGVTLGQVSQALGAENANVPTGRVDSGTKEATIRLQGEVTRVEDLEEIVVAIVAAIQGKIDAMNLPDGYSTVFVGRTDQIEETTDAFGVAMLPAIILIYVVLASQFGRFIHTRTLAATAVAWRFTAETRRLQRNTQRKCRASEPRWLRARPWIGHGLAE